MEVMKVTNLTKLWDTELARYILSATCWIWLYGLEYSLRIHGFRAYLTFPECQSSCYPCIFFWTIWLYYGDQLCLPLLHNKYFCWFPQCYGPKLDYITPSLVQLSNYTWSETMHNVSVTKDHDTTNHSLNCFDHMIYMPQTSSYQNITKLLTQKHIQLFTLL